MDTGFCQVPEIFPGSYKPPLLFWVSESSALNRGTGPSDYIETRKGIWYKGGELNERSHRRRAGDNGGPDRDHRSSPGGTDKSAKKVTVPGQGYGYLRIK